MPSDQVVIAVTPRGREWHVEVDESPLLILQSKETAIAEAQVQAVLTQPSRVVIYTAAGEIEEETACPVEPTTNGAAPSQKATEATEESAES